MNRLIIIGNGFDLAHGFETSYNHFLIDYFKSAIKSTDYLMPFNDELINVQFRRDVKFNKVDVLKHNNLQDLLASCKDNGVVIKHNYALFEDLLKKTYITNWVDFETEYYNQLIVAYDAYKTNKSNLQSRYIHLRHLNKYFDIIKEKIVLHLNKVNSIINVENTSRQYDFYFKTLFREEISPEDIVVKSDFNESRMKPDQTYFLNFNYTDTLSYYLEGFDRNRVKHNQIHGNLSSSNNPIIFGYGDELNSLYSELEDLNENEFLEHMKSFQYSNNSNYHNLIRFINNGDYQVYILGHSCGISDRVMLNRVFESGLCKSIKLFYFEKSTTENDYRSKRIDISRHFKNKSIINELIVPFDKSRPLSPK